MMADDAAVLLAVRFEVNPQIAEPDEVVFRDLDRRGERMSPIFHDAEARDSTRDKLLAVFPDSKLIEE
jgi:hypothetical protein